MVVHDTLAPTMVITVPDTVPVRFTVAFSATDAAAGVRHYDVQFKEEGGAWANWLVDTLKREMDFIGTPGEVYYFRAQATDNVNNVSAWVEVGPIAVKAVTKYYALGGQKVAMRQGEEVYFLHGDHLGSTSLTTDQSQAVVSEVRYHPYGEERWTNGESITDFGFTGQRSEKGFGLVDYNARYYSPGLGRFVSPDSIVPNPIDSQAFNRYSYANNNPIRFTDPSGHCGPICWTVVALVVGYTAYDYLSHPDIAKAPSNLDAMIDNPPSPTDLPGNDEALCLYCRDLQDGNLSAAAIGVAIEATPLDEIPGAKRLIGAVSEQASKLISTLSKNERGPVLTGVMDTQTGEMFFGTNQKASPENLHPILKERLGQLNDYLGTGGPSLHYPGVEPGSHSEIYALSEALYAREARSGQAVTASELGEFLLHNRTLRGSGAGTGVPPRCGNCEVLTDGVTIIE